jgi:aminoglycoside phosphotransferase (APT) family kinase protein
MLKCDNLLSKRQINKILKDFYNKPDKLISKTRLTGGKSNAAYKVVSSSNLNGILIRSAHVDKTALLSFEKNMMAREQATAETLAANGVPVPKVLKYCPYGSVIKREYAIYEFIPSDEPKWEKDQSGGYVPPNLDFDAVNDAVNRMHAICGNGFGYLSMPLFKTWYEFILSLGGELLGLAETHHFFEDKQYTEGLRAYIQSGKEIFDEIKEPFFVHNDIGQKNMLFKNINGKFVLHTVIDIERSMFGDTDWEFSRAKLTDENCYSHIMNDQKQNLPVNRIKRLRIYSLLNLLISMHTMKVKHRAPDYFKELRERYIDIFKRESEFLW